jgi:hypothetical protein
MDASKERVFHYHAASNALGGVLTHPYETVITSDANSALANAGGYNGSKTVPYHLDHVLHCDAAYTHVTGGEEGDYWATVTTAVVEGINLMEVVTADKIVAQISSKHPKKGRHAIVSFVGAQFINLRINGQPIEPVLELHPLPGLAIPGRKGSGMNGKSSSSAIPQVSSYHHPDVRKLAAAQSRKVTGHKYAPDWIKNRYGWLESVNDIHDRGHLLCTLVKEIKGGDPDLTFGQVIHVPGFGNVFLAEVSCDANSHHLTMLRAEMGCASSGTVSLSSGTINGKGQP